MSLYTQSKYIDKQLKKFSKAFMKRIAAGGGSTVRRFWTSVQGTPNYESNDVRLRSDHMEKAVPICFHGDIACFFLA